MRKRLLTLLIIFNILVIVASEEKVFKIMTENNRYYKISKVELSDLPLVKQIVTSSGKLYKNVSIKQFDEININIINDSNLEIVKISTIIGNLKEKYITRIPKDVKNYKKLGAFDIQYKIMNDNGIYYKVEKTKSNKLSPIKQIITSEGKVFQNCILTAFDKNKITVMHSAGITTIRRSNIIGDFKEKFIIRSEKKLRPKKINISRGGDVDKLAAEKAYQDGKIDAAKYSMEQIFKFWDKIKEKQRKKSTSKTRNQIKDLEKQIRDQFSLIRDDGGSYHYYSPGSYDREHNTNKSKWNKHVLKINGKIFLYDQSKFSTSFSR